MQSGCLQLSTVGRQNLQFLRVKRTIGVIALDGTSVEMVVLGMLLTTLWCPSVFTMGMGVGNVSFGFVMIAFNGKA